MQMGRTHFQVSGLSRREPGSGIRVRVQVQVLNFAPYPYLYLITRTRDLRAETWDPKMSLGRADHPWSATVEQGCSTLPISGGGGKRLAVGNSFRPSAAGARSRLPMAERLTSERLMPRWPSPAT
jgi:hypothetical protein